MSDETKQSPSVKPIPLANQAAFRAELLRERRRDLIWLGAFLIFLAIVPAEFAAGVIVSVALLVVGMILIIVGWTESRSKRATSTTVAADNKTNSDGT